jgi:hypothetical protein
MVCRAASIAIALLLAAATSSIAQEPAPFQGYAGTPEDQKACHPAVMKFCKAALPDTFRILACLQQNRPRIGRPCQTVLANYGQ